MLLYIPAPGLSTTTYTKSHYFLHKTLPPPSVTPLFKNPDLDETQIRNVIK